MLFRSDTTTPGEAVLTGASGFAAQAKLSREQVRSQNKADLQEIINNDPEISPYLKVVMVENYNVTKAEKLIPACDISEQISTAGYEASGTSNMKFSINGALTLGTMDGANIEIVEKAGIDNNFIFGLSVDEVKALKSRGYNPWDYYNSNPEIKSILDWFDTDYFTPGEPGVLSSIKHALLGKGDPFLVLLKIVMLVV